MMMREGLDLDGWHAHAEGASMRGALGWWDREDMPALRVGMPCVGIEDRSKLVARLGRLGCGVVLAGMLAGSVGCVRINEESIQPIANMVVAISVVESVPDMVAVEFLLNDQSLTMSRQSALAAAEASVARFNQRYAGFAEASVVSSSDSDIAVEYRFSHGISADALQTPDKELTDLDLAFVGLCASMRSMTVVIRVDPRGGVVGYDRSWTFVDPESGESFVHELAWSNASAGVYSRAYEWLALYGPMRPRREALVLVGEDMPALRVGMPRGDMGMASVGREGDRH